MNRLRPDVDIVQDILRMALEAKPDSTFIKSLLHQYLERGGLSKKQLEGLHSKASKIDTIPPGKLATLEAIILKKPTRYKSALPEKELIEDKVIEKDEKVGEMIDAILAKYPQHKRVLYFKLQYDSDEGLTPAEQSELQKFVKILEKK